MDKVTQEIIKLLETSVENAEVLIEIQPWQGKMILDLYKNEIKEAKAMIKALSHD